MHLTTSHTDHFFPKVTSHIIFSDFVFKKRSGDRYMKSNNKRDDITRTSYKHHTLFVYQCYPHHHTIGTFLLKNEKNETINSNSLGGSITYGSNCLPATCCHSLQWCGASSHRSLTIVEKEMTSLKDIDFKIRNTTKLD